MVKGRALLLTVTAMLLAGSLVFGASSSSDNFKVTYFNAANTSGVSDDATIRVTNPGNSGVTDWVLIYVFDSTEELQECCGCSLSVNDLRTISVNNNLTANTLTGVFPTQGPIFFIADSQGNPGAVSSSNLVTGGIRVWATQLNQPAPSAPSTISVNEAETLDATLSTSEISSLATQCGDILAYGSGYGECSCGSGE